ncbi:MAG TPA: hypothetical protein VFB58_15075 [Chloroflexota bacterium]|nr:hypothetical protein [Chloroflexota bacterium]
MTEDSEPIAALDEALRHSRAGLRALEAARQTTHETGHLYATHVYVATVELAHAIEVAMRLALREQ